jgi:hypothetical protein
MSAGRDEHTLNPSGTTKEERKTMGRRLLILFTLVCCVAGVAVSVAQGYDRAPLRVSGLKADHWGIPTTPAERSLRLRYAGISGVYCVGAIMAEDPEDSSFLHGLTRYWDKLACFGRTYTTGSQVFALIFDAKGQSSWIIYRLKGVSIADLRG